jgi:dipeptidyl aminopeptidase/acylaminoacyl peptidase
MRPLTEDRPAYFIRGGSLHPDGRSLFYGANYDFSENHPADVTSVYRHDLQTGQRIPLARPIKPAYILPRLNRAGTQLIYSRKDRHPSGSQVYLVDIEGQSDQEILNFGDQVKVSARWFPDNEHILVLSDSTNGQPQTFKSLGIYHWPSKTLRWLVDDPGRSIENAWVSPDGAIVVDEIIQGNHAPTWIDPSSSVETAYPRVPGNLVPLGRDAAGNWIATYYSATSPQEIVRFSPSSSGEQNLVSLTRVWTHTRLQSEQLVPAENYHWTSEDGLEIQGWLYRSTPNRHKAVLFIHGGPTAHSENRLNAQIQYLVRCGFNVLDVNYRGSTGFGLMFREAIKITGWGGSEQVDITSAAKALIRQGLAQPGCVGVTGTSYGGYSAWCQITHAPRAVIGATAPVCGMTDLVVDYQTTRPDLRPLSEEMLGGSPEQAPRRYHERSPINYVQNITGGLLIVQGGQDPNVSPENVREVVKRLEAGAIPYDLLVFDDEGHGIFKPENQAVLYTRLADFFEQSLKPAR